MEYKVDLPKSNFKEKKKVVKKPLKEVAVSYNDIYSASQDIETLIVYLASKIRGNSMKLAGFVSDSIVAGLNAAESDGSIMASQKIKRLVIKNLYNDLKNDGPSADEEII